MKWKPKSTLPKSVKENLLLYCRKFSLFVFITKHVSQRLMLLFCFYSEYISLQIKEIYEMSILEEIIPILVLKWLWILLIWAGFLIRRSWFVTFSKFYQQEESLKKNKFHQLMAIAKKNWKHPYFTKFQ